MNNPAAPHFTYDALVIGAGPAGAMLARQLARAGWKIALVEKDVLGRDRVCGGFVGYEAETLLRKVDLPGFLMQTGAVRVSSLILSSPQTVMTVDETFGGGFGVDRSVFDRALTEKAIESGVHFFPRTLALQQTRSESGLIRTELDSGAKWNLESQYVIQTCGRRSPKKITDQTLFALKTSYTGLSGMSQKVVLHFVRGGHVGFNQLNGNRFAMCLLIQKKRFREAGSDMDRLMETLGRENPRIEEHLKNAVRVSGWTGCPAQPDFKFKFFDGLSFYAGDAVTMPNPIIGAGISLAMGSACLLAEELIFGKEMKRSSEQIAKSYGKTWRQYFKKKFFFSALLGWCETKPRVVENIFSFLAAKKPLLEKLYHWARPQISASSR